MKNVNFELPQPEMNLERRLREAEERIVARIHELEKWRALKEGRPAPPPPSLPPMLPQRQPKAPGAVLASQRTMQRAFDEEYFRAHLQPGNAVYYFGAAAGGSASADAMQFPDGAATIASCQVEEREHWVGTQPKVEIWYTSPVGNVATFDLTFLLLFFGAGGTTAGATRSGVWSPPGPAVAGTILKTQFLLTGGRAPSSPYGFCRLYLSRNGVADANNGQLDVLLALVTMEERA